VTRTRVVGLHSRLEDRRRVRDDGLARLFVEDTACRRTAPLRRTGSSISVRLQAPRLDVVAKHRRQRSSTFRLAAGASIGNISSTRASRFRGIQSALAR
jgi:hypothetical protein